MSFAHLTTKRFICCYIFDPQRIQHYQLHIDNVDSQVFLAYFPKSTQQAGAARFFGTEVCVSTHKVDVEQTK
jgi:hypothetical protein